MLQPKRLKHRRQFRGIYRRVAIKGNQVNFGTHGIKTLESGMITDRQIEACRVVMARATRKAGRFWMRIFPDRPYTKKPPEVTMGAGKGVSGSFVEDNLSAIEPILVLTPVEVIRKTARPVRTVVPI